MKSKITKKKKKKKIFTSSFSFDSTAFVARSYIFNARLSRPCCSSNFAYNKYKFLANFDGQCSKHCSNKSLARSNFEPSEYRATNLHKYVNHIS